MIFEDPQDFLVEIAHEKPQFLEAPVLFFQLVLDHCSKLGLFLSLVVLPLSVSRCLRDEGHYETIPQSYCTSLLANRLLK